MRRIIDVLLRKKKGVDASEGSVSADSESGVGAGSGKGHATRSRKEAQAARQRPLVARDRKSAKEAQRTARNEAYAKQQHALAHGIERDLPARDKGRARRFARDYIDAGYNFGELFMPMAILLMVAVFVVGMLKQTELYTVTTLGMYVVIVAGLLHAWFAAYMMSRTLKKYVPDEEIPRGTTFYAFQRAFQVRRWRLPKPQVARGEWPQDSMTPLN